MSEYCCTQNPKAIQIILNSKIILYCCSPWCSLIFSFSLGRGSRIPPETWLVGTSVVYQFRFKRCLFLPASGPWQPKAFCFWVGKSWNRTKIPTNLYRVTTKIQNQPNSLWKSTSRRLGEMDLTDGNQNIITIHGWSLAETEKECNEWTVSLLNFLGFNRYKVSQQKAQITRKQVIYKISGGQWELRQDQK